MDHIPSSLHSHCLTLGLTCSHECAVCGLRITLTLLTRKRMRCQFLFDSSRKIDREANDTMLGGRQYAALRPNAPSEFDPQSYLRAVNSWEDATGELSARCIEE